MKDEMFMIIRDYKLNFARIFGQHQYEIDALVAEQAKYITKTRLCNIQKKNFSSKQ